jgi:hypothetical protein
MTMYRVIKYAPRVRTADVREKIAIQLEADSRLKIIKVESYLVIAIRNRDRNGSWKSEVLDSPNGSSSFGRDRMLNLIPVMIHMCT